MKNTDKDLATDSGLIELEEDIEEDLTPDTSILGLSCIRYWLRSYAASSVPCALFDKKLNLIYQNTVQHMLFPDFSVGKNFISHYYKTLGEEEIGRLYRCIRDPQKGHSYLGKITYRSTDLPTIIANLMISPIYAPEAHEAHEEEAPIGWSCHFNDVTTETQEMLKNTFRSLLEASKLKDNDTGNHIERVNSYSALLAEKLYRRPEFSEIDLDFISDIRFLAAMHDVGKIGTPDDILNKKGPLEKWEWDIMKEHTKNGAYLLATYPKPMAREIALTHHEKWDGNGYPYGLSENMIPLSGRIVAIADVYDALRSKRSYKEPMSHEEAAAILHKGTGNHFDPRIIEVFSGLQKEFNEIFGKLAD